VNIDSLSELGKPGRARYDSPRRRAQALQTRAEIAAAARRLFAAHGWAGTRVRDVAREAGVAEPTVYAIYGSKAGLAMALVDAIEAAADLGQSSTELDAAAGHPEQQLAVLAGFDRRLFERGGDVVTLLRDAGRSEPSLQEAYAQGRSRADRSRQAIFAAWPPGTLRPGMTPRLAGDTYAALCNIDVYRVLTQERGWPPDRVERWWHESLILLMLVPAVPG
jgi:TetR/AcrR family transcriptional regulator, regulator of cefoperazone and chloramphenicol sensitivity